MRERKRERKKERESTSLLKMDGLKAEEGYTQIFLVFGGIALEMKNKREKISVNKGSVSAFSNFTRLQFGTVNSSSSLPLPIS